MARLPKGLQIPFQPLAGRVFDVTLFYEINRRFSTSLTVSRTRIRSVVPSYKVINFESRVFFYLHGAQSAPVRTASAERLINTLFGAKDGGQHHQECALALTSLRCTRRRCALATLSYDNMVPGPKFGTWILDQVPYCRSLA